MKKTSTLKLKRVTLRDLDSDEMAGLYGGGTQTYFHCPVQPNSANCSGHATCQFASCYGPCITHEAVFPKGEN